MAKKKAQRIVVVEPHKVARVEMVEDFNYDWMSKTVGGYIEAVYPWEDKVALVCNEESKVLGMELNRPLRDEDGDICDIVAGTFFICGLGREDFNGLTEELAQKYAAMFMEPFKFVRLNGKIIILPEN